MLRIITCLLILLTTPVTQAIKLWQLQPAQVDKNEHKSFKTLASDSKIRFQLNNQLLLDAKLGDKLTLPVNLNSTFDAAIKRIKRHENGSKTYFASIATQGQQLPVIITLGKKLFFARIVTPDGVYVVTGKGNKGHLTSESLPKKHGSFHKNDYVIPDVRSISDKLTRTTRKKIQQSINTANPSDQTQAEIDVLFLVSQTAVDMYGDDATTRINHIIAVTNEVFLASKVFITIKPAALITVDYPDSYDSLTGLEHIRTGSHEAFANIVNLRLQYGADLVTLFRPLTHDNYCGRAYANGSTPGTINSADDISFMYNFVGLNCPSTTTAHEIGHNLGLMHSRRQDKNVGTTFDFALGHGVDNRFSTIMTYPTKFNASQIYRFSNPELECDGLPCGVDKEDKVNGADAAFALNAVRFEAANFYHKNADLTLVEDAILDVADLNLRSCIQKAVDQDNILYANALRLLRCDSKNISSVSGLENFKGLTLLELNGNLINDVSNLAALTLLKELNLSRNKIVDISALRSLNQIQILSIGENQIHDISALSAMTRIHSLSIAANQVSDISAVSSLRSLLQLVISDNQISDITPLSSNTYLSYLNASSNQITDLSPLVGLSDIETLYIMKNPITDLSMLSLIPSLVYLDISGYKNINVSQLGQLAKLESLRLIDSGIDNIDGLAVLSKLRWLYLSHNNIKDISVLTNLKKLEDLQLSNNPIADFTPLASLSSTSLRSLGLRYTKFEDTSILSSLHNLSSLRLAGNNITNINALSSLSLLGFLDVSDNPIKDLKPILFSQSLWYLRLNNSPIYCWQLGYLKNYRSFDIFNYTDECDSVQKDLDFDLDGLTNGEETLLGSNPTESDSDNDGTSDYYDQLPTNSDEVLDSDHDGIGNIADPDDDNDGILDNDDAFPLDTDNDGINNSEDTDDDNDGVVDTLDISPWDADISQTNIIADTIFSDAKLRACVINKAVTNGWTMIYEMTNLDCHAENISALDGLESFNMLTALNLSNNQIIDVRPLTTLTKLTTLDLRNNQIDNIVALQDMLNLTQLKLSKNKLYDISALSNLSALNFLSLSDNQFNDEQLISLSNLHQIETLYLRNSQISDISMLANLLNLTSLYLNNNQIVNITPLRKLTSLQAIRLNNNLISDITPLFALQKIQKLDLSANNQIACFDLDALEDILIDTQFIQLPRCLGNSSPLIVDIEFADANLSHCILNAADDNGWIRANEITHLQCSTANITNLVGIDNLVKLTSLILPSNQIVDIAPLAGMINLMSLDLRKNQIKSIASLINLINLTTLKLSKNQITNISVLADLVSLNFVSLSANSFADSQLVSLQKLVALNTLYLRNNQITDISSLVTLSNLTKLYLENNQVVDLSVLANVPLLTTLRLYNNKIKDITVLFALTDAQSIDLRNNNDIACDDINALVTALGPEVVKRPDICVG